MYAISDAISELPFERSNRQLSQANKNEGDRTLPSSASIREQSLEASYFYAQQNRFEFELQTKEGDRIRISVESAISAFEQTSYTNSDEGVSVDFSAGTSQALAYRFEVSGDINSEEKSAIENLLAGIGAIADQFYAGDLQAAFAEANSLGYDGEQIAGFAFAMEQTTSEISQAKASQGYQNQPGPGLQIAELSEALKNQAQAQINAQFTDNAAFSLLATLIQEDARVQENTQQQLNLLLETTNALLNKSANKKALNF